VVADEGASGHLSEGLLVAPQPAQARSDAVLPDCFALPGESSYVIGFSAEGSEGGATCFR
jgi:hypothetical protein